MIVLITVVLPVKADAHDNHRLLSYHDNGFAIRLSHYQYYCTSLKFLFVETE